MSRSLACWFAAALLLLGCGGPEDVPRLVLIGIDGGSWKLIDPLWESGELPHLAALRERGMTAELTSVEPLISPAVWTSIATGRSPQAHGITSFFGTRYDVRVPTVWERFAAAGLKVGLYDYLLTWPPRALPNGFVVPGWLRRDDRVAPRDLFERIGLPAYSYEVVDMGGPDDVLANLERELADKPRYWNRLSSQLAPDVGAVTFYALDVASHHFYHTLFPQEFDPPIDVEPRFDGAIPRVLAGVDRAVGEIVAGLDRDDHVIVVSDHGVRASTEVFRRWGFDPDWLFERAGLEPQRDGIDVINAFIGLGLEIDNDAVLPQLAALFAGLRTAAGDPVFRYRAVREPAEAEPWMREMMEPRPEAHAFFFASPIAETFDKLAPDGRVELGGDSFPLSAFASPHVFTGDHHPTGIFLAAGRAIRHRSERTRLSVLDVAPLLAYLAGQPIADDLEGRLDESWIEPRSLRRHPPRWMAADEAPRLPPEEEAAKEETEGEEEIKTRLRALGYA